MGSGADFDDDHDDHNDDDEFRKHPFERFPIGDELGDGTAVYRSSELDTDTGLSEARRVRRESPWRVGSIVAGHRITGLLGEGATGAVYSALEQETGNRVALKVLFRSDANTLNRLKRGFRALAEVWHPNLVMLYKLSQHEDHWFISMEHIDGPPLLQAIQAEGIRDPESFYERLNGLLREAGRALHTLHSNQLVHRDIKPNNILIDHEGKLRLIDYGMVGSFDPVWDPDGHRAYVAGNQKYMAPEVLMKQNYPPGSDIFSLGRVISKLARTAHPYGNLVRLDEDRLLPVDAPRRLVKLIRQMLSVEVSARPTAWEVVSTASGASEATQSTLVNPWHLQIVGRDDSMQQARRWLSRLIAGQATRLHITAPPGIGKSRFLAAIAEQLKEHRWLQVFESRCRRREEVPLQAFDEMIDALARRYGTATSSLLELDPVSTQILRVAFPVLRNVLKMAGEVPRKNSFGQAEANDASVRLASQVCRHGPVILIIDDLQWADQDSLALIQRLETEVEGLFGVITASRDDFQPPNLSPADQLNLRPLTVDESTKMLRNHLLMRRIELPEEVVQRMVRMAGGNCHHLLQLAACVSAFTAEELAEISASGVLDLEQLWQRRFARLTNSQQTVLTHVVAAGGPVDIGDVLQVSRLGESGRQAVAGLLQENWLNEREQTHHIEIFHDTIAEALIDFLPAEPFRKAHAAWAEHLIASEKDIAPAHIAGQLIAAGQSSQATSYVVAAAEDAMQKYAFGEAARWHHRAAQLLSGGEAVKHLRLAAQAFSTGGQSAKAAEAYLELAAHPDEPLSDRARGMAAEFFLRAGEIHRARDATADLARRLGLPQPKPQWLSKWRILKNVMMLRASGGYRLPKPDKASKRNRERARTCFRITRALTVYDNIYSAELLTTGLLKLDTFDTYEDCIHSGAAYVAFGSYDAGWWRRDATRLLAEIQQQCEQHASPEALAHTINATGYHHWFLGEFAEAQGPLEKSSSLYRHQCNGMVFESVHALLPHLASLFFLGHVKKLLEQTHAMIRDARDRDDQFTRHVATTGFAASALLFLDRVRETKRYNYASAAPGRRTSWQFFHSQQTVGLVLQKMYSGYPQQAVRLLDLHRQNFSRSGFFRLQVGRVWWLWLRANATLQAAAKEDCEDRPAQHRSATHFGNVLCRESLPVAQLFGDLVLARIAEREQRSDEAQRRYLSALQAAEQQQLEPFRLIAQDGLDALGGKAQDPSRLQQFLAAAHVQDPVASERLYTVNRP
ncbi:serine/threonine-protein kinase [Roseimaritima sediminicola]|uniref:serine/threonine-protein kinase n=1 Tax=Roseimaritima sediminicola TaxID=2662066 RepID=UPI00138670B5|nr:serine/threonine-protein kinase [Roseimaritima sediminicola]